MVDSIIFFYIRAFVDGSETGFNNIFEGQYHVYPIEIRGAALLPLPLLASMMEMYQ